MKLTDQASKQATNKPTNKKVTNKAKRRKKYCSLTEQGRNEIRMKNFASGLKVIRNSDWKALLTNLVAGTPTFFFNKMKVFWQCSITIFLT